MAIAKVKTPRQVGRYHLAYELAPSFLGPLWAARIDGSDPGTLALLRLVSLSRLEADTRVRLLEAAWQAMEVRDDRVAAVTDVVASDGELCIVSEYAEGLPLRAAAGLASVRRKPMPVPIVLRFLHDIADGVIALHRAMVELGDEAVPLFGGLSADSVLILAEGRACLLDVAISSAASTVESLGGTPERIAYAAPEQVGASSPADARTDVFALGILAWEMLANRRLFIGSDKGVAQKVLAAKVPRIDDTARKGEPEIPAALVDAVMRALSADPAARFPSAEAFRAALEIPGVVPALPADAASYVGLIADGALARAREALSLPPRPRPAPIIPPAKIEAKPAVVAEKKIPATSPRPGARLSSTFSMPKVEPKPVAVARPRLEPNPTKPPEQPPKPEPPKLEPRKLEPLVETRPLPSVDSKPVVTSQRVSIEPKPAATASTAVTPAATAASPTAATPSMGWRALEPPSTRSVPPAKVRPRQNTMIGLPPPADSREDARRASQVTEPPPSSDGSDEPTAQYSREHLKQLAGLAPPAPASVAPPRETGPPLPRLQTLQPTPRPLSEIHTERPPPPEPEAPAPYPDLTTLPAPAAQGSSSQVPEPAMYPGHASRAPAPLPPAPAVASSIRVAAAPLPARVETPFSSVSAGPSVFPPRDRIPPRTGESMNPSGASVQTPERPAFSRPPPATAPNSYMPSHIAPPLIHDPRANRMRSMRPGQPQFTRGVVIGVVISLALVATSTMVALFFMRSHPAPDDARSAPAAEKGAPLVRTEGVAAAPGVTPGPVGTASAAVATALASAETAAPSAPASGSAATTPVAETPPSAEPSVEPAPSGAPETPSVAAAPSAMRAAPSHAPRAATRKAPKKHATFIPADI